MGHPTCIIEGLACWLILCILEKIICNSTNSVQISFIETLKLIVFSWTIWWCYWQNVLMINEKNNFLTVSWLCGLLSAEIFISTGEWGVQMPPLTSENSYFLRSGPQGATLVMRLPCTIVESPRRHKRVPFVNITSPRSRSIKRRQWKHKLDYYGVVFAHLATGYGINAKDPSGLDSDRWIPHSRCCENPARAKALAGFSHHLSAGSTDLNPAPRGLSLYNF